MNSPQRKLSCTRKLRCLLSTSKFTSTKLKNTQLKEKKNNKHLTDSFHNSYRKEVARNQRLFLFSVCGITIVLPAQAQLKIVTSRACQSFLLPRTASAEGETSCTSGPSRTDRQTLPHPRTDRQTLPHGAHTIPAPSSHSQSKLHELQDAAAVLPRGSAHQGDRRSTQCYRAPLCNIFSEILTLPIALQVSLSAPLRLLISFTSGKENQLSSRSLNNLL